MIGVSVRRPGCYWLGGGFDNNGHSNDVRRERKLNGHTLR